LKQDKLMTFAPPELDENATPMQKEMWRIRANNTIKCEELLKANLEAMHEVVLSICDPVLKDQVCNHEDYEDIDNDPFPKTVAEACHVLSKWENPYGRKYNNNKIESNDGIAFATETTTSEKRRR